MLGPKVPPSHATDRAAVDLVRATLPGEWTKSVPEQGHDYGVDLWIQVADNGVLTPYRLGAQLKGTAQEPSPRRIGGLKARTLELLVSQNDPTVLIQVNTKRRSFALVPTFDQRVGEALMSSDATTSIPLSEEDTCESDEDFIRRLGVLAFRGVRSRQSSQDSVWIAEVGFDTRESREVARGIQALMPHWMRLDANPPSGSLAVQAELHWGERVYFVDRAQPRYRREIPDEDRSSVRLALWLAMALDVVGWRSAAAELGVEAISAAERFDAQEFIPLISCIHTAKGDAAVVRLAERAAASGRTWGIDLLSVFAVIGGFDVGQHLSAVRNVFASAVEVLEDPKDIARNRLNMARLLRSCGEASDAFEEASRAGEYKPYRKSPQWHEEIARDLFVLGRAEEAASHYQEALDCDADASEILPLLIHAHLVSGKWSAASEAWEQLTAIDHADPLGFLSAFASSLWSPDGDVTQEGRDRIAALLDAGDEASIAESIGLCPVEIAALEIASDWYLAKQDLSNGFRCVFTEAVLKEGDARLWAHALILGVAVSVLPEVRQAIAVFAAALLGDEFWYEVRDRAPGDQQEILAQLQASTSQMRSGMKRGRVFLQPGEQG